MCGYPKGQVCQAAHASIKLDGQNGELPSLQVKALRNALLPYTPQQEVDRDLEKDMAKNGCQDTFLPE